MAEKAADGSEPDLDHRVTGNLLGLGDLGPAHRAATVGESIMIFCVGQLPNPQCPGEASAPPSSVAVKIARTHTGGIEVQWHTKIPRCVFVEDSSPARLLALNRGRRSHVRDEPRVSSSGLEALCFV